MLNLIRFLDGIVNRRPYLSRVLKCSMGKVIALILIMAGFIPTILKNAGINMAEHVEAAEVTDANEDDIAVSAPASSELYSSSCAVMDGYSGRILYGKSSDTAMANASTTKILTCILALEYGNLSDTVTASARAAGQPKVRLGMSEGDSYVLEDLLYCLMLESYNDCAVAIAEHISGSVEAFADLMNEKAAQIGCKDTYFITPNGLDDEDENGFHHTTAEDLCLIMRYCTWESSKCKAFLSITQTAEYTFTDSDGISHTASNHNSLLTSMDGAITGKTGYTNDAGYCYVMAYEKDGRKFCVALLACGWPDNKNYKWKDANTLISYAVSAYTATDIYQEPRLPVITVSGSRPRTPVLSDWGQDVSFAPELAAGRTELIYMISAEDEVSYNINIQHSVDAPIMAGDAIGYYSISVNGETVCEYAICATAPAYAWTFAVLLRAVFSSFAL